VGDPGLAAGVGDGDGEVLLRVAPGDALGVRGVDALAGNDLRNEQ
jgi:hypothetical protein